MELSQQSIHDVIHPTAAFSTYNPDLHPDACTAAEGHHAPWEDSHLNPKNRIDALTPPANPLWRIDGCTAFGTQYYAVPLFMGTMPPFRVDVFIPEPATLPADVRNALDLGVTFYTRNGPSISRLGIANHILRVLQHWTSTHKDLMRIYDKLPFGSRIVFHNLPKNVASASISIAPTHHLERQLFSSSSLKGHWGDCADLPRTVDINDVVYISQVHDSVCLVEIHGKTWILKALTSYTKYLFHELRQLLVIPPHPNIVARPVHLVTKKCKFGNKTAIVGFTLEYHSLGSLRDLIPFMQLHGQVSIADKTKWSLQLASALMHLHLVARIFYPDLRLDNMVLSERRDVIMIDFEQRGVWCEFAAPEVNAIEYIRLLAIDDELDGPVRDRYRDLLAEMLPGWESLGQGEGYEWPSKGYNVPWLCLTRIEQEACEVYMLARVLWCIFEANSAPQRAAVWLSYPWEPQVEFPEYTTTPEPIRRLIDACTRGRRPGLSKYIVRRQQQLVLRELEHLGTSTAEQVQETATHWWTRELENSEEWLRERNREMSSGSRNENYYGRPTLQEVTDGLRAFWEQSGFSEE